MLYDNDSVVEEVVFQGQNAGASDFHIYYTVNVYEDIFILCVGFRCRFSTVN